MLNPYQILYQCRKCTLKYKQKPNNCKCNYDKFIEKNVYNIEAILSFNAFMNLIIGVRRIGKTYAVGQYCIDRWLNHKERFIWIRRWKTELAKALNCFAKMGYFHDERGVYEIIEKEVFSIDKKGKEKVKIIKSKNYIGEVVTLSTASRFRGFENNDFNTIVFDEYADESSFGNYNNDLILLDSLIFTILDEKEFAKVFVLSNAVNRFLPLFKRAKINWNEEWTYNNKDDIVTHIVGHKDFEFVGSSKKYLKSGKYWDYAVNNASLGSDDEYLTEVNLEVLDPKYRITMQMRHYEIYEYNEHLIIKQSYNNNIGEIIDLISSRYFVEEINKEMQYILINAFENKKIKFSSYTEREEFFKWINEAYKK